MAQIDENENVEDKTIVANSPMKNLSKHPLDTAWTLWYFKNDRDRDWEQNQREVASFDTVEDFWAIINNIEVPSNLAHGCDYSLFRKGIRPMWEDNANKNGGRWFNELDDKRNSDISGKVEKLDRAWLEVIMCLVGEAFGKIGSNVTGAVCQRRVKRKNKLSVWLRTAHVDDESSIIKPIGEIIKQRCVPTAGFGTLGIGSPQIGSPQIGYTSLYFEDHKASQNQQMSRARAKERGKEIHRLEIP